jgi:hypothetical protein
VRIVGADLLRPPAPSIHSISNPTVGADRPAEKTEIHPGDPVQVFGSIGLGGHDDQGPGDIVGGVSLAAGMRELGVLPEPPLVGE